MTYILQNEGYKRWSCYRVKYFLFWSYQKQWLCEYNNVFIWVSKNNYRLISSEKNIYNIIYKRV